MRVRTTLMAPSTAMAPPESPVPAPRGTSGTRCRAARRTMALTSAVLPGKTTASGRPGWTKRVSSRRYGSVASGR